MADPLLAQSAIDRLQSAAHELVLDGESYRQRQEADLTDDRLDHTTRRSAIITTPTLTPRKWSHHTGAGVVPSGWRATTGPPRTAHGMSCARRRLNQVAAPSPRISSRQAELGCDDGAAPDLIYIAGVAGHLGVNIRHSRKLVARRRIPYVSVGTFFLRPECKPDLAR